MERINSHKSWIRWRFSYLTPPGDISGQATHDWITGGPPSIPSCLLLSFLCPLCLIWYPSSSILSSIDSCLEGWVTMVQVAELEFCSLAELSCQALGVSSKIREWLCCDWVGGLPALRYFIINIKTKHIYSLLWHEVTLLLTLTHFTITSYKKWSL